MNLPNKLTVARMLLTVVFVVVFYLPVANRNTFALLVFGIASITDYFDGEIARKRGLVTNFGKLLDPVADKVLMCAALVLLAVEHPLWLPGWTVVVVLAREFIVTGIRLIAASAGKVLAAEKLGKHKTAWQIITALYFLIRAASGEPLNKPWLEPIFLSWSHAAEVCGGICVFMMTALTLVSGVSYFWKNRALFADA